MVNVIDLSDIGAAREDEKPKSKGIHIAVIEPGKDPYLKKVAPDADGNYTSAFQDEVGGLVEAYEPPFGETPLLWVNEEFLFNGSTPNRAIYANKRMEGMGYLSEFGDHSKAVKAGRTVRHHLRHVHCRFVRQGRRGQRQAQGHNRRRMAGRVRGFRGHP